MKLCRFLLAMAAMSVAFSAIAVGLTSPRIGSAAMLLLTFVVAKKRRKRLTTLGSARWAEAYDMLRAGMLRAKSGLILGRVTAGRIRLGQSFESLADRRLDDELACQAFVGMFMRPRKVLARLTNAVHTAIFAPTAVGKGVSCIVPFLLTMKEPCFVLDVKDGELARLTAEARRKMGRKVYILDPYRCVTNTPGDVEPCKFYQQEFPVCPR